MPQTLQRIPRIAQGYIEPLLQISPALSLHMVLIPGGTFVMGSSSDEPERTEAERPQHQVTVPSFMMGRYPVTQAQWRAVAAMPQEQRSLDPDPSRFKGDNHPVEQVSWYEAVEFCDRLSTRTKRPYRLPTEAEWEYACRAGTTTPFHFGDRIATDVANYDGDYAYGDGKKGKNRRATTPVDLLDNANALGLSDMHGNVYEWCQDHWHMNYEGALTDGSAWSTDNEEAGRVLRGGSWIDGPRNCRSACRYNGSPGYRFSYNGFRVSCVAPRALV